jgi:hypothetical protein
MHASGIGHIYIKASTGLAIMELNIYTFEITYGNHQRRQTTALGGRYEGPRLLRFPEATRHIFHHRGFCISFGKLNSVAGTILSDFNFLHLPTPLAGFIPNTAANI